MAGEGLVTRQLLTGRPGTPAAWLNGRSIPNGGKHYFNQFGARVESRCSAVV